MFARLLCIVAILATVIVAEKFTLYDCPNDQVNCEKGCYKMGAPTNECVTIRDHGDTWDCDNIARAPCYNVRKYPLGSNCTGTPIANRANFCNECKGQDPHDYLNRQKRICKFSTNGERVDSVDYYNCEAEFSNNTCKNCESQANVTFSRDTCVEYEGGLWRLEESNLECPLMLHVNFKDTKCQNYWWGDRIVLGACNMGWKFECPKKNQTAEKALN